MYNGSYLNKLLIKIILMYYLSDLVIVSKYKILNILLRYFKLTMILNRNLLKKGKKQVVKKADLNLLKLLKNVIKKRLTMIYLKLNLCLIIES